MKKTKVEPRLEKHLLTSSTEIKSQFLIEVKNQYSVLNDEAASIEDKWQNICQTLNKAAEKVIPKQSKKKNKARISNNTLEMIEK